MTTLSVEAIVETMRPYYEEAKADETGVGCEGHATDAEILRAVLQAIPREALFQELMRREIRGLMNGGSDNGEPMTGPEALEVMRTDVAHRECCGEFLTAVEDVATEDEFTEN